MCATPFRKMMMLGRPPCPQMLCSGKASGHKDMPFCLPPVNFRSTSSDLLDATEDTFNSTPKISCGVLGEAPVINLSACASTTSSFLRYAGAADAYDSHAYSIPGRIHTLYKTKMAARFEAKRLALSFRKYFAFRGADAHVLSVCVFHYRP